MTFWPLLGIIVVAGAVGGILYCLITDNGFPLPAIVERNGIRVLVVGFIGNILIGMITAGISWAFYGLQTLQGQPTTGAIGTIGTVLAVFGGIFTGLAGAGWFGNTAGRAGVRLGAVKPADDASAAEGTAAPVEGGA